MDDNDKDVSEDITETCFDKDIRYLRRCRISTGKNVNSKQICLKEEKNASIRKISTILQKSEEQRTSEETQILNQCSETVEQVQLRLKKRDEARKRLEEIEDPIDVLQNKCQRLAQAIAQSQHLVVYTGAGISTAAKIPDYRGPDGIWTKLQQGRDIGNHDLSSAEPTYTHMALSQLYHQNILKYVVSQNCDGLHLRSGLPRFALSELHGNMYIEVCKNCRPPREYLRLFDVTENTARFSHKTNRKCYRCNHPLMDTIVHFGERGTLYWPLNWSGACRNARKATTIICLGSSLKVLKRYPWLWQMDKPLKKRPNLYIVNLQWTPKDDCANMKIHGKCDEVMKMVMSMLGIQVPKYDREKDPIFFHATRLCKEELHTTTRPSLEHVLKNDKNSVLPFNHSARSNEGCDIADTKNTFTIESILKTETSLDVFSDVSDVDDKESLSLSAFDLKVSENMDVCYSDLYFYPYQTSFLYSGLHSIISPSFFNAFGGCDAIDEANYEIRRSSVNGSFRANENSQFCEFCCREYRSPNCLFYVKYEASFASKGNEKMDACLCCNSCAKEEDRKHRVCAIEDRETVIDRAKKKRRVRKTVQPGWFGKGYGKYKRNRRR